MRTPFPYTATATVLQSLYVLRPSTALRGTARALDDIGRAADLLSPLADGGRLFAHGTNEDVRAKERWMGRRLFGNDSGSTQ